MYIDIDINRPPNTHCTLKFYSEWLPSSLTVYTKSATANSANTLQTLLMVILTEQLLPADQGPKTVSSKRFVLFFVEDFTHRFGSG